MKRARLKKFGPHVMNKVSRGILPVEEKLIELPEIPDHNDKFCHKSVENKKDRYFNTFLYTEYLKRKFFIDCKYQKENNIFKRKNDKRESYIKKEIKSKEEFERDIINNLIIVKEDIVPFLLNIDKSKNINKILEDTNFDIYFTIKKLFHINLNIIKSILINPDDYSCYINNENINFIKSLSVEVDDYFCERCLYFHTIRDKFIKHNSSSSFNLISNIIDSCWTIFDFGFLNIYKNIIDKYSLYMTDIFNLSNIEDIINNNYQFPGISRYFFLPHEPEDVLSHERNIDIITDYSKEKINISVDLANNFDAISLSKFIYECMICSLYNYKNITGKHYSIDEVLYFIDKIDFKDSRKIDPKDKINGLFIWDRVYRENYSGDISTIIIAFP